MPQIAGCHAVDVRQPTLRIYAEIDARHQFKQLLMGTVGDGDRQRRLLVGVDIAADNRTQ